jgi:NADPH:quinone reductase-like Zn-dependent oxidoreductase
MRAIVITDFGSEPAVQNLPTPTPGEGEALVRVRASSVNGFDLSVASGRLKEMMEHRFPVVLGKDIFGTVEAIGAGVEDLAPGDEVFGVVMKPHLGDGAFGEWVATPTAYLAKVPDGVDQQTAGALGLVGTAATDAIDAISPGSGETVLVAGATGGVGSVAVQLLKGAGARVIATAATEEERAFVMDLGADATVDYRGDLASAVKEIEDDLDAALHFAGDDAAIAALLREGGRLASTLGFSADHAGRDDIMVTAVMANPVTVTLDRLAQGIADGALRLPIQRTYALADVPQAFRDFAEGTLGKLAVTID